MSLGKEFDFPVMIFGAIVAAVIIVVAASLMSAADKRAGCREDIWLIGGEGAGQHSPCAGTIEFVDLGGKPHAFCSCSKKERVAK